MHPPPLPPHARKAVQSLTIIPELLSAFLCVCHRVSACRGDFGRLGHGDCSDVFVPQQIAFFNSMAIKQVMLTWRGGDSIMFCWRLPGGGASML
jgi:hypothetical protein